ncbi:hypothetical protein SynROS8604_02893 [Synechococcus sp. ROS8604]|nr:hypothetical protein SynROS8604_02893 [Synechococcus sp. ROS8604]
MESEQRGSRGSIVLLLFSDCFISLFDADGINFILFVQLS